MTKKEKRRLRQQQVREMFGTHHVIDIARILCVSVSTIKQDVIELKLRGKGVVQKRRDKVSKLFREGKTTEQIAKAVKVSTETVKRDLQKMGLVGKKKYNTQARKPKSPTCLSEIKFTEEGRLWRKAHFPQESSSRSTR